MASSTVPAGYVGPSTVPAGYVGPSSSIPQPQCQPQTEPPPYAQPAPGGWPQPQWQPQPPPNWPQQPQPQYWPQGQQVPPQAYGYGVGTVVASPLTQEQINDIAWQEPRNWRCGFRYYYSSNDKRLCVPKRNGCPGRTVNHASPYWRTYILVLVLLVIATQVARIVLATS